MHFKDTPESVPGHRSGSARPTLLNIGLNLPLEPGALPSFRIIEAESSEDVSSIFAREDVAVLIIGPRLTPKAALSILDRHSKDLPGNSTPTIVLCAGCEPDLFQAHVNAGRIFYIARKDLEAPQLLLIATCAAARFHSRLEGKQDLLGARVTGIDELVDFCIRLPMQADLPSAARLLVATAHELLNADLIQYLVYDADDETLAPADTLDNKEWSESAAAGLAAFAVHTGERIRLDCVGLDPRYDSETDNPGGMEDARFLAEPLLGTKASPVGVITATRSGKSAPFTEDDVLLLQLLAECAAPTFNQIALQNRIEALLLKRAEGTESNSDVFRKEALEHHIRSWDQQGEVLKTLPPWLRATYWVMLVLVFAGLLGTVLGKVNIYASGPAVIRTERPELVIATAAGRVRSITVSHGDAVRAGDPLVVIDGTEQVGRTEGKTETLRAAADGVVGEIRVRPGQVLKTGDQAMTVVGPDTECDVIAFLPESNAPQLHPGMTMRLRLGEESSNGRTVQINRVGRELLDPSEAIRYAGKEGSANFSLAGRTVVVRAALPTASPGRSNPAYRDGITGEAEVSVRSESVIFALIPGLRTIFGKAN